MLYGKFRRKVHIQRHQFDLVSMRIQLVHLSSFLRDNPPQSIYYHPMHYATASCLILYKRRQYDLVPMRLQLVYFSILHQVSTIQTNVHLDTICGAVSRQFLLQKHQDDLVPM